MPGVCVQHVLDRVKKARRSNKGWAALCPAHEDTTPSLSITEGDDGRVLLCCHVGCTFEAIADALGLERKDLFPEPIVPFNGAGLYPPQQTRAARPRVAAPHAGKRMAAPPATTAAVAPDDGPDDEWSWPIVDAYDYVDADDQVVFQVVRKEPVVQLVNGKRRKTFRQRRPDGRGGWIYGLEESIRRPLYHLPEIIEAVASERVVFVVEGEKDVATIGGWGFTATTNAQGAKGWRTDYADTLRDADVVLLPDNDDPGRAWAEIVASSVAPLARRLRIVALSVTTEGADVSDWAAAGHTADELTRVVARTRVWSVGDPIPRYVPSRFRVYSDVDIANMPPMSWLAEGVFSIGSLTAIYGAPGAGKSFLSLDLACAIATGRPWLNRAIVRGLVLYVVAEGGVGFRQRVLAWKQAAGYEGQMIGVSFILEAANLYAEPDVTHILRAADAMPDAPRMVVFDTLARSMVGGDENSAQDMGLVIERADIVRRHTGAMVQLVHHSRKEGDMERGSIALRAGVDTLGMVRAEEDGHRVLHCEKQKDGGEFPDIPFDLKPVGDSCIVTVHDPRLESHADTLTPRRRAALGVLSRLFPKGASATEWMKATGLPERTFYDVRAFLVRQGYASEVQRGAGKSYSLTESGRFAVQEHEFPMQIE